MGVEINLLENYPKTKRDTSERAKSKSEEVKKIARKFGYEFFDSDRKYGYGGFNYNKNVLANKYQRHPNEEVIKKFTELYNYALENEIINHEEIQKSVEEKFFSTNFLN